MRYRYDSATFARRMPMRHVLIHQIALRYVTFYRPHLGAIGRRQTMPLERVFFERQKCQNIAFFAFFAYILHRFKRLIARLLGSDNNNFVGEGLQ